MLHILWFVYIRPVSFYHMSKKRHLSNIQCDETSNENRNPRFANERPFWMNAANCDSLWCCYIHKFEFNKIFIYHKSFLTFHDFGSQFNFTSINFPPHESLKVDPRVGWPRRIGSPSEVRRFGADGSIFGPKTDPIAEAEAKILKIPIRFSPIRQYANLIGLKRIGSDSIFRFFRRIGFYFSKLPSERK